jgi:hypothetical protein
MKRERLLRSAKGVGIRASPAAGVLFLSASSAWSAELPQDRDQALPCRPTVSCTADITAPGTLEVEAGFQFARLGGSAGAWSYPVLLKQTFTELVQLQVGTNGLTTVLTPGRPSGQYLDNLVFGPKLHVLDQGRIQPSLAITAQIGVPTFENVSLRAYDAFLTGHVSKDFGPIHVDWNGAAYLWGINDSSTLQWFTAVAAGTSLVAPLGMAVEIYGLSNAAPLASKDGGVRVSANLTPRPWLIFDFGGDPGFFPKIRSYTLFVGLTIIPVVFWRAS